MLEYFDSVISPVACYAARHTVQKPSFFYVLKRNFLRSVVGDLATYIGHHRGTKCYTRDMDAFKHLWDSRDANLALKSAYGTIGTWPIIWHCYQTTGGSNGFCIGTLVGANGLDARNIFRTAFLQISAASKMGDGCYGSGFGVFNAS